MGCMRFPTKKNSKGKNITDEKESIKMVRYAVENGVNYFDTAYVSGDSKEVVDIIDSYNWDICQIQLNFIRENY